MMIKNTFRRLLPLLLLLVVGVWLLRQPPALPPAATGGRPVARGPAGAALPAGRSLPAPALPVTTTLTYAPVAPTTVDFASAVRDAAPAPEREYRMLNAETAIPGEGALLALRAAAAGRPPSPDLQQARPARAPLAPRVGFESIDFNQSGGAVPPDPELAVGPNHIVVAVNAAVSIYDKVGNTLQPPTAARNLFTDPNCRAGLYDPNVVYDEKADRWILAYDKGARSQSGGYCLLASQTPNPQGLWTQYFFPLNSSSAWLDFPHAGVGDEYLLVGGNMFDYQAPSRFVEGRVFAFPKATLYDPIAPVTPVALSLGNTYDTPQPLHLHGYRQGSWPAYGTIHYFLAEPYPWDGRTYTLFRWNPTTPVSNLSETIVGHIDLGSGSESAKELFPLLVPQQQGDLLEANDFRPLDFEYRNGYGWTAMTVACNPGSGAVNCVRWAQIDLSDATLGPAGRGLYGSNGAYRFFPDLAVNQCNDMLVGYTRSGSSSYPGAWVAGRHFFDAPGSLRPEQPLRAGDRPYTSFEILNGDQGRRWGDYGGLTIDPDGVTFWYLGQYSKNISNAHNTNWGTYAGAFTLSPDLSCALPEDLATTYLPLVSAPNLGPEPARITLKQEDFESAFPEGWLVYDQTQETPAYHWAQSTCRAATGAHSGGAVASAVPCGQPYPAGVASWMVYGPFDLGDATDAAVTFNFWNQSIPEEDTLFWGISIDQQTLYGSAFSGDSGGWQPGTIDLKAVPGLGDVRGERQVWLAFVFSTDGSEAGGEGGYLDDIHLWKETGGSHRPAAPAPAVALESGLLRPAQRPFPGAGTLAVP